MTDLRPGMAVHLVKMPKNGPHTMEPYGIHLGSIGKLLGSGTGREGETVWQVEFKTDQAQNIFWLARESIEPTSPHGVTIEPPFIRENGPYWLKDNGEWTHGDWDGRGWWIPGSDFQWQDADFEKIGAPLPATGGFVTIEMVERVAEAICTHFFDTEWPPESNLDLGMGADDFRRAAGVAIEAMREPTECMENAAAETDAAEKRDYRRARMTMTEREEGFYWVKVFGAWRPALWSSNDWQIDGEWNKDALIEIEEIGPHLIPPEETLTGGTLQGDGRLIPGDCGGVSSIESLEDSR